MDGEISGLTTSDRVELLRTRAVMHNEVGDYDAAERDLQRSFRIEAGED